MAPEVPVPTLNQQLGFAEEAKLLLINADDAGMCHAANLGTIRALEAGMVKSTTVMAPCPWVPEITVFLRANPQFHCGIHLAVTSEWDDYRWGPVAGRERVPSLLDAEGYFFRSEADFFAQAKHEEVEIEFRAQVERVLALGLQPTHLDSHMGAYHWDEDIFQIAKRLAREFGLTMRIGYNPRRLIMRQEGWAVVDRLWFDTYDVPIGQRKSYYEGFLEQCEPGVTELVIHCGVASDELTAICGATAAHRTFDMEFFSSPETRQLLADLNITCIDYRMLQELTNRQLTQDG
ncbi:MAG TPA: polysaccharide deacetylase family protein [bacterium]|nr:polysaccharide deacetylase family protein [bacterium]